MHKVTRSRIVIGFDPEPKLAQMAAVMVDRRLVARKRAEYAAVRLSEMADEIRERSFPGLHAPPNPWAAEELLSDGLSANRRGNHAVAVISACRGLANAPFHPQLWMLAGQAALQLGDGKSSATLIDLAEWINPSLRRE